MFEIKIRYFKDNLFFTYFESSKFKALIIMSQRTTIFEIIKYNMGGVRKVS